MIDIFIIKLFLIIVVILFSIGTFLPLILIKRKGIDPHGSHEGCSNFSRLTPISIMLWLVFTFLYILFDNSLLLIWHFAFLISDVIVITGITIIIISFIFSTLGIINLGLNYRIELPKENTELITSGIFNLMRNPFYFGVYLLMLGTFLIIPNFIFLVIIIFNIITFDSKARDEEKFLIAKFGRAYKEYQNSVGRYFPFTFRKEVSKNE